MCPQSTFITSRLSSTSSTFGKKKLAWFVDIVTSQRRKVARINPCTSFRFLTEKQKHLAYVTCDWLEKFRWLSPLCLSLSGGFGWPRGQPQKNHLETKSACRKIARLSKFFTPGQKRLTKTMAAKIAEGEDHVKKAEKYLKTSFMKWSPDYDSAGWCLPKCYRFVDIIGLFLLTTNH